MPDPSQPRHRRQHALSNLADHHGVLDDSQLSANVQLSPTWVAWTPTLTQTGNLSPTVNLGKYLIVGKLVTVAVYLTVTAAGTTNTPVILGGIPAAIAPLVATDVVGTFRYTDTGTAWYVGAVYVMSSSTLQFTVHNAASDLGQTPNFAAANGDVLAFKGCWEIA